MEKRNQVHPPRPKQACVDSVGNVRRKMWLKEGNATMLFVEGLTENGCKALINHINTFLKDLGVKPLNNNKFLITR